MIRPKKYLEAVLETDLSEDILLHPVEASAPVVDGPDVIFSLAMARKKPLSGLIYFDQDEPDGELFVRLRFYAGSVLRMSVSPRPQPFAEESPMLAWDTSLQPRQAVLQDEKGGWASSDGEKAFFRLGPGYFAPQLSPDGVTHLAFQGADQFFPHMRDALPLYARLGSRVEFAEPVQHTGELSEAHRFTIGFDNTYPGFEGSELGKYIGLSNTY